jgi:formylmethanofuran dehydrogenase subunit E
VKNVAKTTISEDKIREAIAFHGHWCPGLATGIRVAELALREVGRAGDEDIVAVAESDTCAVDAVQVLTGCTVGKGNLVLLGIGKMGFSFYRRRDGKAIRIVCRPPKPAEGPDEYRQLQAKSNEGTLTKEEAGRFETLRQERGRRILEADLDELFELKVPIRPVPPHAPMKRSLTCEGCGESVMETKARLSDGRVLCPDCFEKEVPRP